MEKVTEENGCWECGHIYNGPLCKSHHEIMQVHYENSCESCMHYNQEEDLGVGIWWHDWCEIMNVDNFKNFPFKNGCKRKVRK
jgi:hypothetical protein